MKRNLTILSRLLVALFAAQFSSPAQQSFAPVAALFSEHCLDCHSADDPDGKLVLETFEDLMKGGESGPAILPGKSSESLLVKMIEGRFEKDGKVRFMPPGKRDKLSAEAVAVIAKWIDAGAPAPSPEELLAVKKVEVPKIAPKTPPLNPILALAYEPKAKLLALGRSGEVQLHSAESQLLLRSLPGHSGNVNALAFSPDGKTLWAAGGENGIGGELKQWTVAGETLRTIQGHRDSIYALALSPDGKWLATGSYDQTIKIWNAESGDEVRTLTGHNGCVYALAFRPDGKILASASGDRTVKLWDAATGERRDTLAQSLKEIYTLAFAPDGKRLAAAGVDNRIRVWEISESAAETTNPLLYSKFGHDSPILKIAFSANGMSLVSAAEDRTLKLWEAGPMKELRVFEPQPDWAPALAFILEDKGIAAGGLDGSLAYYNPASGSALLPPKPEIVRLEPRGVQRGFATEVVVTGKNLHRVDGVKFADARLKGALTANSPTNGSQVRITVTAGESLPRGTQDLTLTAGGQESAAAKLHIDDIPQIVESEDSSAPLPLPAAFWGVHNSLGDSDRFTFQAQQGQTLVFDAAAGSIGSKAGLLLNLLDSSGRVLDSSNGFDASTEPLIAHTFAEAGDYTLEISELVLGASEDHFYRITAGAFPFVAAAHPSLVPSTGESEIQLVGFNLTPADVQKVTPQEKKAALQLDPEKYRWRNQPELTVSELPLQIESEPNNTFETATSVAVPSTTSARIFSPGTTADEDWFRFEAKGGQVLIIETAAARLDSPADTVIEVRDSAGQPVLRTLLQAVRDSAVTFRPIDSSTVDCRVDNWEEMELNQYLYLQGEVVRIFRMPQGPDSGFHFYALNGRRRNYFDTTATVHANGEPCYIVEPHPPGTRLVPNGLPVFELFYQNDDDADRKLGTDSKLQFTAPRDGAYHVRVRDTRGFGGDRFLYRLTVREAQPDFIVTLSGANPSIAPGSGQTFTLNAERIDGFDEDIKVEISGLPPGFTVSSPIVIQAGHGAASGTINAAPDAVAPTKEQEAVTRVMATAQLHGKTVNKDVNHLGKISLAPSAPLYVEFGAAESATPEIIIAPGQTVPAHLTVRREGHTELITFAVNNLPHGIIVDNIGLNGVLIPKEQSEREIFLTAARWVPETDRYCFAISNEGGRQTSMPVLIKVRKNAGQLAGK